MTVTASDRRALRILAVAVGLSALYLAYDFMPTTSLAPATATPDAVDLAEQRLSRLRDIAASRSAKQDILKQVNTELRQREAGLIRTETAQQAQAQIITRVREVLMLDGIELRSTELGPVELLGDAYGLAPVTVQFECRVEQLLNALAAISAQPELLATRDLQIASGNPKDKTVRIRLTLTGVVPQNLAPAAAKKGRSEPATTNTTTTQ